MPALGQWELVVLGVVLLLLFGSKQLPALARSLGLGLRDVRQTMADVDPRTEVRALEPAPQHRAQPEERKQAEGPPSEPRLPPTAP